MRCDPFWRRMLVLSCTMGEGLKLRYQQYIATINDRLRQLEDLAYTPEDVQAFKDVMSQEARVVLERSQAFERKPCEFVFMEATMRLKISDINDEWGFRLEARTRSQAVSQESGAPPLGGDVVRRERWLERLA